MNLLSIIRIRLQELNYSNREMSALKLIDGVSWIIIVSTAEYFLNPFFSFQTIQNILRIYEVSFFAIGLGIFIGVIEKKLKLIISF